MPEPTVINDELNNKQDNANPNVESVNQNSSEESKVWNETYPKWQKSISKEYWGNEKLARFDSLNAVIEDILNPKTIEPQNYDNVKISDSGLRDKAVEAFKKTNIPSAEAEAISKLFEDSKPKVYSEEELKDVIGLTDYEVEKAYRDNALSKICANNEKLKQDFLSSKFVNEPSVFKILSIVGKNLGDGTFDNFKGERTPEKKDVWREMVSKPKNNRS